MSKRRPHIDEGLLPLPPARPVSDESRVSLSVTVLWMLTAFATFMAEAALAIIAGWLYFFTPEGDWRKLGEQAFAVLALVSVILGFLTLVMTWAAYKLRDDPPPASVARVAIAIGAIPVLIWLLLRMLPR